MIHRNAWDVDVGVGVGVGVGLGVGVVLMKGAVDRHVTGNLQDGKHAWQIKNSRFIKWQAPVSDPSTRSEGGLHGVWEVWKGVGHCLAFRVSRPNEKTQ